MLLPDMPSFILRFGEFFGAVCYVTGEAFLMKCPPGRAFRQLGVGIKEMWEAYFDLDCCFPLMTLCVGRFELPGTLLEGLGRFC
jgi:hypothetical protein